MKKMKIGVMTFFRVNNFGAVLQAWALQKVLMKEGYLVETIDYECTYLEKPYRLRNIKERGILSYCMSLFGYLTRVPRKKKFNEFIRGNLQLSETYYSSNIEKANDNYDFFIAGSDQIWNISATNCDVAYFLNFVTDSRKKGTYAASFGKDTFDKKIKQTVEKYLLDFRYLYVRENSARQMLDSLTKRNSDVVLDPTMLLDREAYEQLFVPIKQDRKYVLVYQQNITKSAIECASRIAKKNKLEVICIPFPIGKIVLAKCKTNYSPGEWLWLIDNAECVVTDSFHGMVFSIIFNKSFYLAVPQVGKTISGRMTELLGMLSLEDRIISETMNEDEIDYGRINTLIEKKRKESRKKLIDMLKEYEETQNG